MTDCDQFGYPLADITTPDEFIVNHGKADLDCWCRDKEALTQHVFLNAANHGKKHITQAEANDFAEKVIEARKTND